MTRPLTPFFRSVDRKVLKSYRYVLTPKGRDIITAVLTMRQITMEKLDRIGV